MNVVNAGRAEIVADALLELQRHAATRDLTYDIRLCVIDPEAPETGAALMELQSAQSQISSAEAEAFLHTTGPARTAKLVHSVRSVDEFTRQPEEFDAHLTVLIDAFGGEQHSSMPHQPSLARLSTVWYRQPSPPTRTTTSRSSGVPPPLRPSSLHR